MDYTIGFLSQHSTRDVYHDGVAGARGCNGERYCKNGDVTRLPQPRASYAEHKLSISFDTLQHVGETTSA